MNELTKAIIDRHTEITDLSRLKRHPRNPRVHPDSLIEKLVRSIATFGWTNPIIVAKDGTVLAGHARLTAAQLLGITHGPVVWTELEGDQADAYLLADNRIAEESSWDRALLKEIFLELDHGGFDLNITAFDLDQVEELLTAAPPPNARGGGPGGGGGSQTITVCPKCGYAIRERKD